MKKIVIPFFTILVLCTVILQSTAQEDCNTFYPFKKNTKFTLESSDAKGKPISTADYVMSEVKIGSNTAEAIMDVTFTDAKDKPMGTVKEKLTCDKGIIRMDLKKFASPQTQQMSATMEVKLEGDESLELPSKLTIGQVLKDAKFNIKISNSGINILNQVFEIKNRKVDGKESVTVKAGTFECYKISQITVIEGLFGKKTELKSYTYFSEGVGMVKTESFDGKGKPNGKTELVKFQK